MTRVYLDSCFIIYLMEEVANFSAIARSSFAQKSEHHFCISPLLRLEVLVHPLRSQNQSLVKDYEDLLAELQMLTWTDEVFQRALNLRVAEGLKTPDALHLGTAIAYGCSEFWTNDNRLSKASGGLAINIFSEITSTS